jgi:hypothetical protein
VDESPDDHGEPAIGRQVVLLEHDLGSDDGLGIGSARHGESVPGGAVPLARACANPSHRLDCPCGIDYRSDAEH